MNKKLKTFEIFVVMDMQVKLMCSYCKKHNETEVPDPYYGGQKGFEKVKTDCFVAKI